MVQKSAGQLTHVLYTSRSQGTDHYFSLDCLSQKGVLVDIPLLVSFLARYIRVAYNYWIFQALLLPKQGRSSAKWWWKMHV